MRRCFYLLSCFLVCVSTLAQSHLYKLKKWDISPSNYSGITPIGDGLYAIVSDKEREAGFYIWEIKLNPTNGKLVSLQQMEWRGVPYDIDRDAEGIAFCPERNSLFISGEADQRILEHHLDGSLTGNELHVPKSMGKDKIQNNRGFEALGYDKEKQIFWTTTESNLLNDPPLLLRLQSFGLDLEPKQEVLYNLDSEQAKNHGRDHYHGVVAITPLGDDTLLILEREARITKNYNGSRCWCKLFLFNLETNEKTLLDEWKTRFAIANTRFANYEGMCLGPKLDDGRQTLLMICDSQAGFGRGPWHLRDKLKIITLNF